MSEFFLCKNLSLRYEPFPIGHMSPMVEPGLYAQMCDAWPSSELFEFLPRLGNKYSLSATCHPDRYRAFVKATPIWRQFDDWVNSPEFIEEVMQVLLDRHVDVGFRKGVSWARQTLKNVLAVLRGRRSHRGARFKATWEFQMMPGQGGHLLPHTDSPDKVVSMTLSIVRPGEWDTAWGGGIDLNHPLDVSYAYNQLNRQAQFEDMEVIDTIEFLPNTGVIFIKTFNSWHSVRPMQAPHADAMRRNLVINIKSD